jgi:F0F1-type ATP synthase assembly protein I
MMPRENLAALRQVAELSSLGLAMVLCSALGLGLGYYLDQWLVVTRPVGTVLFFVLGIAAGFGNLYVVLYRRDARPPAPESAPPE